MILNLTEQDWRDLAAGTMRYARACNQQLVILGVVVPTTPHDPDVDPAYVRFDLEATLWPYPALLQWCELHEAPEWFLDVLKANIVRATLERMG